MTNSLPAPQKGQGHIKRLLCLEPRDKRLDPEREAGAQPRPCVAMERLAWPGAASGFWYLQEDLAEAPPDPEPSTPYWILL